MLDAIVLGAVQGITEFLPVSSTGHLIIAHDLLGFETADNAVFDILLQLATALAAAIYFRRDIFRIIVSLLSRAGDASEKRLGLFLIVATVPAVIVGLLFEDRIESVFRNTSYVSYALLAGSALMAAAEYSWKRKADAPEAAAGKSGSALTSGKSIIIGCFQALALIPGVSRSGSTISGALFAGLGREEAVRFSFLLSIPIIAGAAFKKMLGADASLIASFDIALIAGFVASFAVGLASIHFLTTYLRTRTFAVFVWYRVILAFSLLILL